MRKTRFMCIVILSILFFSSIFVLVGHMAGEGPFEASAVLTRDDAELCLELNTYLEPHPEAGYVDYDGYNNCCMFMNQD